VSQVHPLTKTFSAAFLSHTLHHQLYLYQHLFPTWQKYFRPLFWAAQCVTGSSTDKNIFGRFFEPHTASSVVPSPALTVPFRPIVHTLWCVTRIVHWHWCSWPVVMRDWMNFLTKLFINWCEAPKLFIYTCAPNFEDVHRSLWCVTKAELVQFTRPCDAWCERSVEMVQYFLHDRNIFGRLFELHSVS
jgi:hypothetical protein